MGIKCLMPKGRARRMVTWEERDIIEKVINSYPRLKLYC
jgi:hypothetical protein